LHCHDKTSSFLGRQIPKNGSFIARRHGLGSGHVDDHVFTGLFAAFAFVRAAFHYRIIAAMLFTFLGASSARFRARLADRVGKWSLPGDNRGGRGAMRGAILACLKRREVMLMPLHHQVGTMGGTGITSALAIVALFSAFLKVGRLLLAGANLARARPGPHETQEDDAKRAREQNALEHG
jgi:hypothetical protein